MLSTICTSSEIVVEKKFKIEFDKKVMLLNTFFPSHQFTFLHLF